MKKVNEIVCMARNSLKAFNEGFIDREDLDARIDDYDNTLLNLGYVLILIGTNNCYAEVIG